MADKQDFYSDSGTFKLLGNGLAGPGHCLDFQQ